MEHWHTVSTQKDIDFLMQSFCGFHDSYLVSAQYQSGGYVDEQKNMYLGSPLQHEILLTFHSQLLPTCVLRFNGVRRCFLTGVQDNYTNELFDCYLAFHSELLLPQQDKPLIVWANTAGFSLQKEFSHPVLSEPNYSFVIAESLKWKLKSD